ALLRGNADSSWVIHWNDSSIDDGRIWHAKPLSDAGNRAWPVPSMAKLFCAGHSALADGRLLVVGGTASNHTGIGKAEAFDAHAYGQSGNGWTAVTPDAIWGRWYPTVTTTASGRVDVLSGDRFNQLLTFG